MPPDVSLEFLDDCLSGQPPDPARIDALLLAAKEGLHLDFKSGLLLADQSCDDLVTMRQPFLSTEQDHGFVVVHGHSSNPSVHIAANRIGLDTGAGIGGKLTCAVLEDDLLGLLAV